MRAFIAVTFPDFVKDALFQSAQTVKERLGLTGKQSWINPKNYHLTLFFLGEISEEVLKQMGPPLTQAVGGIAPFSIEFTQICLFPSIEKQHAVVASIKPQEDLIRLQQKALSVVSSMGEKINDPRPFLPHVTLARLKEVPVLSFNPLPLSISFRVRDLQLFESRPTQKGSGYLSLFKIQLFGSNQ